MNHRGFPPLICFDLYYVKVVLHEFYWNHKYLNQSASKIGLAASMAACVSRSCDVHDADDPQDNFSSCLYVLRFRHMFEAPFKEDILWFCTPKLHVLAWRDHQKFQPPDPTQSLQGPSGSGPWKNPEIKWDKLQKEGHMEVSRQAQAKSLDDRGSVGYLLDIDIWQSGTTRKVPRIFRFYLPRISLWISPECFEDISGCFLGNGVWWRAGKVTKRVWKESPGIQKNPKTLFLLDSSWLQGPRRTRGDKGVLEPLWRLVLDFFNSFGDSRPEGPGRFCMGSGRLQANSQISWHRSCQFQLVSPVAASNPLPGSARHAAQD